MSLLKKKFGKFAVSQKEMTSVLGGYIDPCTDMFKCDDSGGGGGGSWQCKGIEAGYGNQVFDLWNPFNTEKEASDKCSTDHRCIGCFKY